MEENPKIEMKKIEEFEINSLVVKIHNKIAQWHNEEPNNTSLKLMSLEIVEDIAGSVFNHLGLEYTQGFKMDEETQKKFNEHKKDKQGTIASIDNLSNEDLLRELKKRQLD